MKRKLIIFLLSLTMIFNGLPGYGMAMGVVEKVDSGRSLTREGKNSFEKLFDTDDLNIYKLEDVYMVPVRPVLERLGYKVEWNNKLRQVDITKDLTTSNLKAGENYYFYNGEPTRLGLAPQMKDGVTYVPMTYFEEVLKEPLILAGDTLGLMLREILVEEKDILEVEGYLKNKVLVLDENGENEGKYILVGVEKSDIELSDLIVHIVDETEILGNDEEKLRFEDLRVGDKLDMETPVYMTMSIPPQTTGKKIVKTSYLDLKRSVKKQGENTINYPVLEYSGNKVVESLFNQRIDGYINNILANDMFFDLDLDYIVSALNEDLISLIFRGKFTHLGREKDMIKALNIDLKTGEEITFESYFSQEEEKLRELEDLISKEVKRNYNKDFQAESAFIYFKEKQVVIYYYELDDSSVVPIEVYLEKDKIKDLIN